MARKSPVEQALSIAPIGSAIQFANGERWTVSNIVSNVYDASQVVVNLVQHNERGTLVRGTSSRLSLTQLRTIVRNAR